MTISFPARSGKAAQRPQMYSSWAARFPAKFGPMTAAVNALVQGYAAWHNKYLQVKADATQTEAGRLVKNARIARATFTPLISQLDAASTEAAQLMERLQAKTSEAYRPPNPTFVTDARHREIRAHFKGLSQADRFKMLEAARKEKDVDTLVALASSQAFLSGLPDQMHQHLRDELILQHFPEEATTIKAVGEQRAMVEQFRQEILQSVSDQVDFPLADQYVEAAREELTA